MPNNLLATATIQHSERQELAFFKPRIWALFSLINCFGFGPGCGQNTLPERNVRKSLFINKTEKLVLKFMFQRYQLKIQVTTKKSGPFEVYRSVLIPLKQLLISPKDES